MPAKGFVFARVSTIDANDKPENGQIRPGLKMKKNNLELKYTGSKGSTLFFELTDNETGETHTFDFALKQWLPESNKNAFTKNTVANSGIYCFRPRAGMYEPIDYSTVNVEKSTVSEDLDGIHAFNFEFMEQIPSRFANGGPKDETHFKRAFVHVSIDSDLRAMKFNVDLLGLPSPVLDDGNEVLVQFHVEDLEQQKTFYTDSNGLEMQ